eukprot:Tamp_28860.p3 GENE.Tamp_28860~~Tamp_28860.p3  ORF type:complete len:103 (+),score=2.15 Tamp_28860:246-554(+)
MFDADIHAQRTSAASTTLLAPRPPLRKARNDRPSSSFLPQHPEQTTTTEDADFRCRMQERQNIQARSPRSPRGSPRPSPSPPPTPHVVTRAAGMWLLVRTQM